MAKIIIDLEQFKDKSVWDLKMGIQKELEKIKVVFENGNGRQDTLEPYASFDFSKDSFLRNTKIIDVEDTSES